jgi:hypothetical protein
LSVVGCQLKIKGGPSAERERPSDATLLARLKSCPSEGKGKSKGKSKSKSNCKGSRRDNRKNNRRFLHCVSSLREETPVGMTPQNKIKSKSKGRGGALLQGRLLQRRLLRRLRVAGVVTEFKTEFWIVAGATDVEGDDGALGAFLEEGVDGFEQERFPSGE